MKKTTTLVILLFTIFTGFAQKSKTVTIGILADEAPAEIAGLLEKLQSEITAVVGQDAKVIFKAPVENGFDLDTAKANYLQLESSEVDIILVFGVINNIAPHGSKKSIRSLEDLIF